MNAVSRHDITMFQVPGMLCKNRFKHVHTGKKKKTLAIIEPQMAPGWTTFYRHGFPAILMGFPWPQALFSSLTKFAPASKTRAFTRKLMFYEVNKERAGRDWLGAGTFGWWPFLRVIFCICVSFMLKMLRLLMLASATMFMDVIGVGFLPLLFIVSIAVAVVWSSWMSLTRFCWERW